MIGKRADYANRAASPRSGSSTERRSRCGSRCPATRRGPIRMPFKQRRQVTARLYRKALQWTMFGADAQRTSTHAEISIRPPFKVVWSRGLGSLIEFPAVVYEGVAYIGNYKGTIYAVSMRNGKVAWTLRPARREDGLLAGRHRRRRRRARDGRDRARPRPPQRPSALVVPDRLADRVLAGARERARLLRRLERAGLRARPEAAQAPLAAVDGRQDHLERRRSPARRSTSATTPAG